MADPVYGGLASHTALLPLWASTFSHLRNGCFGNRFAFSIASLDAPSPLVASREGGIVKLQRAVFVLMGMMLLFGGRLSAQQVRTDYDRSANFAQYKTYSWEQVKTQDALDVDRIKTAVNSALAANGGTQVDSSGDVSI